jgi:hypothetical protein
MLRGFSPDEIKSVGIGSGDFNLIHPGEHIDFDKLNEIAESKGHSLDSLIAHAQTLPPDAPVLAEAPHPVDVLPQPPETNVLTPDSIINFNGNPLPLHEAAEAMMAGNMEKVLGSNPDQMVILGRALVAEVPNAGPGDLAHFGLSNTASLETLKKQIDLVGSLARQVDPSFKILPVGLASTENIHDFLIRANTTILEHRAELANGS